MINNKLISRTYGGKMKYLILLILFIFLSCENKEKTTQSYNEGYLFDDETIINIPEPDNIWYMNIPGNTWLRRSIDDFNSKEFSTRLHKRRVTVVEEIEGWKKVQFDVSHSWFEDKYFVRSLGDITPDYDFIKSAVGTYYYNNIEIIKNDYEHDPPWRYDGNIITLNYNIGDEFNLEETNIRDGVTSFRGLSKHNIPNNTLDPFSIGIADGVRSSYYYEYYFINEGIKIRIIPNHYEINGEYFCYDEMDGEFIYDVNYTKEYIR